MTSFLGQVWRNLKNVWIKFGKILHFFVQPVILVFIFFIVLTPLGFLRRFFGLSKIKTFRIGSFKNRTYWKAVTRDPMTDERLKRPF